jgi:hypothetical protein
VAQFFGWAAYCCTLLIVLDSLDRPKSAATVDLFLHRPENDWENLLGSHKSLFLAKEGAVRRRIYPSDVTARGIRRRLLARTPRPSHRPSSNSHFCPRCPPAIAVLEAPAALESLACLGELAGSRNSHQLDIGCGEDLLGVGGWPPDPRPPGLSFIHI